ncbi:GNAT family N-acetyltransferase [Ornithinimicrobium cryptoxanthini]|uniref:GNAT family N-acetyltransferase n=1 Tax=Ornithinimicrobium cryptoxanthini TaxID=2934161 RepID=A0ABY4YH89_9MICO|nr:GNAT family N-acetyltransferase [Ornithinimicrobium cryptoxanthini]USQ75891.1 GNAT family N-acetyltransferase [Ornithinimicrobium cryptoxanthini]
MTEPQLRVASFADLTTAQLYAVLRLRVDVFVVEQDCAYPELDGRDDEPTTEHLWVDVDGEVAAYVRVLDDRDRARVGRVVTAEGHRGHGYAAQLVALALERIGNRRTEIGAQVQLEQWYARLGFARSGPDYDEDGIMHLPMIREAPARAANSG